VLVARGWSEEGGRKRGLSSGPTINWRRGRAGDFEAASVASFRDLKLSGFDLDLIGFEPDQLKAILASSRTERF